MFLQGEELVVYHFPMYHGLTRSNGGELPRDGNDGNDGNDEIADK